MAMVDEKYILLLENLRGKLIQILKDKEVDVNDDETLETLIPKVNMIGQNDYLANFLANNLEEFRLENKKCKVFGKAGTFSSVKDSIKRLYLPYIEEIYSLMLSNQSSSTIEHVYMPKLKYARAIYSLSYLPKVTNLILPSFISTVYGGYGIINYNNALKRFIAPKYNSKGERLSTGLDQLEILDITLVSLNDGSYPALTTLILRHPTTITNLPKVTTLNSLNTIEIYVPQAIIETYKQATNWTTYADCFKALEGSKYEDVEWYKKEEWYAEEMSVWE